jgi:hypothetical protein
LESLLTLIKKESKKAAATMEAIVCLSLFLMKTADNAPTTAMTNETIEINWPTLETSFAVV